MADVRLELVQVLVGQGEANSVLAKFRQHICQGQGGEALELIDVDEERATLRGRGIGSAERRKTNGRHEQTAKEGRAIRADMPLGQVDQEHLSLVHDPTDVQVLLGRGSSVALRRNHECGLISCAAYCAPDIWCTMRWYTTAAITSTKTIKILTSNI